MEGQGGVRSVRERCRLSCRGVAPVGGICPGRQPRFSKQPGRDIVKSTFAS